MGGPFIKSRLVMEPGKTTVVSTDRFVGWGFRKITGMNANSEEAIRILELSAASPEDLARTGYEGVLSRECLCVVGKKSHELTIQPLLGQNNLNETIASTQKLQELGYDSIQTLIDPKAPMWQTNAPATACKTVKYATTGKVREFVAKGDTRMAKASTAIAVVVATAMFAARIVHEQEVSAHSAVSYAVDLGGIAIGYVVLTTAAFLSAAETLGLSLLIVGFTVVAQCFVDWLFSTVLADDPFHEFEEVPFSTYFGPSELSKDVRLE